MVGFLVGSKPSWSRSSGNLRMKVHTHIEHRPPRVRLLPPEQLWLCRRRPFSYKPDAPFSSTTKVECQGLADLMLLPHFFIHWTARTTRLPCCCLLEMRSIMTGNEIKLRFWTLFSFLDWAIRQHRHTTQFFLAASFEFLINAFFSPLWILISRKIF